MEVRTVRWSRRRWWLMATGVLALVLVCARFAMTPANADPTSAEQGAEAEAGICANSGGYPSTDYTTSSLGFIIVVCTYPNGFISTCYFYSDNPDLQQYCFYTYPPSGKGSQTGTYFPAPTVAPGPAGGAVVTGGPRENAPPENGSPPTPTPRTHVGGITIAPINGVAANGVNPTPTPTKGKVGVGGVSIAPISGVKAPVSSAPSPTPLPGPRSGIALNLWDCPLQVPTVPLRGQGTLPPPPSNCHTEDNVTNKAVFLVGGPTGQVTIHGSGILMNGLPAGKYFIRLTTIPSGYGKPVGYCGFAPSEEQGPNGWSQVAVGDGYTVEIPQDQTVYCDWYITYNPANAPAKAALATPMPAAAATPVP